MDYIITTEQLTKRYRSFIAVDQVSLHIRKGSIYGFLGPNGGKIHDYEAAAGPDRPDRGQLYRGREAVSQ